MPGDGSDGHGDGDDARGCRAGGIIRTVPPGTAESKAELHLQYSGHDEHGDGENLNDVITTVHFNHEHAGLRTGWGRRPLYTTALPL